jgi:hypothetical protein
MGTGVQRPGRGADHPPPSMCRGHERVEIYLYSPSGPSWPVIGRTFTFTDVKMIIITVIKLQKHTKTEDNWTEGQNTHKHAENSFKEHNFKEIRSTI